MIVVPIPAREGSSRASSWIVRLAASIVSRRNFSGEPVGQVAVEGVGGGFRGDLAGLGAAHAVGDDEDRRADEERVLVGAALAAGVGAERLVVDPQHQSVPVSNLNSVSPIRITSPSISSASPFRVGVVEQGAVGRAHVLDVGAAVAVEDPGVDAGGVAVLDLHVGVARAADREAADQVEALALRRGRRRARRSARRRRGRAAAAEGGGLVEAGRVGGRGDRAAQVLQRRAGDPEQEQVEDDEEAELERD